MTTREHPNTLTPPYHPAHLFLHEDAAIGDHDDKLYALNEARKFGYAIGLVDPVTGELLYPLSKTRDYTSKLIERPDLTLVTEVPENFIVVEHISRYATPGLHNTTECELEICDRMRNLWGATDSRAFPWGHSRFYINLGDRGSKYSCHTHDNFYFRNRLSSDQRVIGHIADFLKAHRFNVLLPGSLISLEPFGKSGKPHFDLRGDKPKWVIDRRFQKRSRWTGYRAATGNTPASLKRFSSADYSEFYGLPMKDEVPVSEMAFDIAFDIESIFIPATNIDIAINLDRQTDAVRLSRTYRERVRDAARRAQPAAHRREAGHPAPQALCCHHHRRRRRVPPLLCWPHLQCLTSMPKLRQSG
ncbi:MAG: hypothetical protein VXW22_14860, partial [Pseudomonadota bacterium]|nr:hypothetical protein [Pseudomonadota bacterium]